MADYLVPIALSSQLDVTGEERVHAARYIPLIRPVYSGYFILLLGDLPDGAVDDEVDFNYVASLGIAPYVYSIISGSLPTGLTMDEDGNVTGTLEEVGEYSWVVQAVDSHGHVATLEDTCEVLEVYVPSPLSLIIGSQQFGDSPANLTSVSGRAPDLVNSIPMQATSALGEALICRPDDLALHAYRWNGMTLQYDEVNVTGTVPLTVVDGITGILVSDDGEWFVISSFYHGVCYVYHWTGTEYAHAQTIPPGGHYAAGGLCWSPDRTKIALVLGGYSYYAADVFSFNDTTGAMTHLYTMADAQSSNGWKYIDWVGEYILISDGLAARVLNAADLSNVCEVNGVVSPREAHWSADGNYIYVGPTTYSFDGATCTEVHTATVQGTGGPTYSAITKDRTYIINCYLSDANDLYRIDGDHLTLVPNITVPASGFQNGVIWTGIP